MLRYLIEHPGRLVTQEEILRAVWPDVFVKPEALKRHIFDIRSELGDGPKDPRFIETLPRRGYQFIAGPRGAVLAGDPCHLRRSVFYPCPPPSRLPLRRLYSAGSVRSPAGATQSAQALAATSRPGMVKKRLEQMVICSIDQKYLDWGFSQLFRGGEAGKPSTGYDDNWQAFTHNSFRATCVPLE